MPKTTLVVATLAREADLPRMAQAGIIVHSRCIICGRSVCAPAADIWRVVADDHVPLPICRPCVIDPAFRSRVAKSKIESGPGVTKAEIQELAAILKSPGDGTGIN